MKIFKKIWNRYWRGHSHWHNGNGNPIVTHDFETAYLHFVCSLCGRVVKQGGQRHWMLKKLNLYRAVEFGSKKFKSQEGLL